MYRKFTLSSLSSLLFFLSIFSIIFLSSCEQDDCNYSYISYEPIFMSYDEFRSIPVELKTPRSLEEVGKIYFYNDYLFINEINEGVHIIDNSNPASPLQVGFLTIAGNVDIAISGNTLYADSYTDLLVIDINTVTNPQLIERVENTFSNQIFGNNGYADPNYGIVVDWKQTEVVTNYNCNDDEYIAYQEQARQGANSGVAGSMARFAITQNHLYTLNGDNLKSYSILNPTSPQMKSEIELGWGIETLFPYGTNLFIGSQRGMHIYDLYEPNQPRFVSTYEHITSCDPVVVSETTAYVTLRNGTNCRDGVNELHLIDISDLSNPSLINTQAMTNPHGLGVASNYTSKTLFVCDGDAGLKAFNVTDPSNVEEMASDESIHGYDVIAHQNILMLIGKDGLYQYDYRNPQNLKLLSSIKTK
ncbi:hypothetical protein WAF17_05460 [Bernardetia sp. ABR2-2B]|uniref:LVIVD repeat-containing protein n=1 Tax=Bernardetia sp. ABR2-2B TaxID=3127472 RepID=UPI0030D01859